MGAYSFKDGKKIKFWKVKALTQDEFENISKGYEIFDTNNIETGTVVLSNEKVGLFIKAIDGIISVLEIQGENSKKMNILDFLRGNKIKIGEKFD